MAGVGDWSSDGRTVVAATAHKGLVELEVTAQHAVDASEAASFSAAASDAGSTAKVTTSHSMLPTPLDSNSQSLRYIQEPWSLTAMSARICMLAFCSRIFIRLGVICRSTQ